MKKRRTWRYLYRFICSAILVALATSSFGVSWYGFVKANNQTGHLLGRGNIAMAVCIYAGLFLAINKWMGTFRIGVERKAKSIVSLGLGILTVNALEVFVSMAITGEFRFAFAFIEIYFVLSIAQIFFLTIILIIVINAYWRIIPPTKLLVIDGNHMNHMVEKVGELKHKYIIEKRISENLDKDQLLQEITNSEAVLLNDIDSKKQKDIVKTCFWLDKRVYIVPKLSDIILKTSDDLNVVDTPMYLCRNLGLRLWQRFFKRLFDFVVSLLAIIITSPIWLIVAIAIKLEDHGPVFFRQERVTIHEKRFMIVKFRSMIVDAEKDGRPHPAGENDDRITKVGHVIRACRIDELPQLINILKGEMSLVGPRPERWEHEEKYAEEIPEFRFRHKVKGGLTGYAQVYGKYNTSALDKLKLDLIYITNYSFLLDLQIIFETIKILFQKDSTEGFEESRIMEIHDAQDYE